MTVTRFTINKSQTCGKRGLYDTGTTILTKFTTKFFYYTTVTVLPLQNMKMSSIVVI